LGWKTERFINCPFKEKFATFLKDLKFKKEEYVNFIKIEKFEASYWIMSDSSCKYFIFLVFHQKAY